MGHQRVVQIGQSVFGQVTVERGGRDTAHRTLIHPADLVFVVVIAHNKPGTVEIDRLSDRIVVV